MDLTPHLLHHAEGSLSDRPDSEGREDIGKHSAEQQSSENFRLGQRDVLGLVLAVEVSVMEEASEERERDQGGGANSESLTNGSSSVSSSIQSVSPVSDLLAHLRHLGNTSRVVTDRPVPVNSQGKRQIGEHAQSREGDSVVPELVVGDEGSHRDEDSGNEGGEVSQSETESDIGCGTRLASLGQPSHGAVSVRCDVLGEGSNDHSRDETEDGAKVGHPSIEFLRTSLRKKNAGLRE